MMSIEGRFDVFVSCKGGSCIETHADPLVSALKKAGLDTFYYKDYPRPGGIIDDKIRTALKNSRTAILLFSRNYADSYWCLEELRLILKRDKSSVFPLAIIYCEGVSYRDLQNEDNSHYYAALGRHKNASPEKIRKWKKALKNAGWREGDAAPQDKQKLDKFFERIARYIKEKISESSKAPLQPERKRKSIGPCGVPDPPDFTTGLDDPLDILKGMLLTNPVDDPVMPYSADELSMQTLVLISAPPGCGKTTLAKKLCRDSEIEDRFKSIFFVPVSQKVNITVIVQRIYKHHSESDVPPAIASDEDALYQLEILVKTLAEEGVLLVLDDVWSPDTLVKKFMFGVAAGYKLLVTSRSNCASFERSIYNLQPLCSKDAKILFRHSAGCTETGDWQDDHVDEMVKFCNGFPLVITVVGQILRRTAEVTWLRTKSEWSKGQANIVNSDKIMLARLKASVDALDEKMTKCFLDLGLFPEDHRIPTNALIDIWAVLYGFDDGVDTLGMLTQLAYRNLVNFVTKREGASFDGNNLGHFVTLHDVLRMLAIHMSGEQEQRTRLFMEMNGDGFCNVRTQDIKHVRMLSITTTGNSCSSNWCEMQQDSVEVLIVNLSTGNYFLPEPVNLINLKALAITNYGSGLPQISDFAHMIGNLSSLERIRLENVSVPSLGSYTVQLMKLKKISLNLCKIDKALDSWMDKFPNLEEIEIYCCPDLDQLSAGICNLIGLKKLTVTSCNELRKLPDELGKLIHLQHLKLNSCTKLGALPESIGGLENLSVLDISDCVNVTSLPKGVGNLNGLRKLYMQGCWGFVDLPSSVSALNKTTVSVDESKSFLWEDHKNVKVRTVKQARSLTWLHRLRKKN